jgi:hypothetical protein
MEIPEIIRTIKKQFEDHPKENEADRMAREFEDVGRKFANKYNILGLLELDEEYSRYIDLLCGQRHLLYAIDYYNERILEQARKRGISASAEIVSGKERFRLDNLVITRRVYSTKIDQEKQDLKTKGFDQRVIPPMQNAINELFIRLEQIDRVTGERLGMNEDEIPLWGKRHSRLIAEATKVQQTPTYY